MSEKLRKSITEIFVKAARKLYCYTHYTPSMNNQDESERGLRQLKLYCIACNNRDIIQNFFLRSSIQEKSQFTDRNERP